MDLRASPDNVHPQTALASSIAETRQQLIQLLPFVSGTLLAETVIIKYLHSAGCSSDLDCVAGILGCQRATAGDVYTVAATHIGCDVLQSSVMPTMPTMPWVALRKMRSGRLSRQAQARYMISLAVSRLRGQ